MDQWLQKTYKFKNLVGLTWKMDKELRIKISELAYDWKEGHIPSAFSIIDILSVLYGKFLKYDPKNPDWEERDYFVLSKGHGCFALYTVLEKYGFISKENLYEKNPEKRILGGHPDGNKIPGVETSTGSLGHGIGIAAGIALGLKIKGSKNKVITLIGDGESNEGTIWETALVAPNLKLGNLCVIIDNNKSCNDILPVPDMRDKWLAFGWNVYEVDGHSEEDILDKFARMDFSDSKPKVLIANTIKGKGVSFIENQGIWHHRAPTDEELEKIKEELK